MRTFAVFVLVVFFVAQLEATFPFKPTLRTKKGAEDDDCPVIDCVGPQSPCDLYKCSSCSQNLGVCFNQAVLQPDSNQAMCTCWETYVNCLPVICNPYNAYESCQNFFSSIGYTCGCGVPATGDATICAFDLYCDESGLCEDKKGVGSPCTQDDQCGSSVFALGAGYDCVNGKCELTPGWANVGDGCNVSSDCAGSGAVQCLNGVCSGVMLNGYCRVDEDCNAGLFCYMGKCASQIGYNQKCPSNVDPLAPCIAGVCASEGVCINYFSKALGSRCNNTFECNVGLVCANATNTCQEPTEPKDCQEDSDCGTNGVCNCDFDGHKRCENQEDVPIADPKCAPIITAWAKCVTANNCKTSRFNMEPDSCAMRHCANEENCLANCLLTSLESELHEAGCFGPLPQCNNIF